MSAEEASQPELPSEVDVAIVGAGLVGAASAWHTSRRGMRTLVQEQFDPATVRGSSHGSARIVRRAYAEADYVRLTGELDHGSARDPAVIADALSAQDVPSELLPPQEAAGRWPGMVFEGPVLWHPQAGTMDAEGAVHAFLEAGGPHGMQWASDTEVSRIEQLEQGMRVQTSRGDVRARTVVVAAGAWTQGLLGGLVPLPPLRVTEHRVLHFPRADESVTWPVTIHFGDLEIYHLPGGRDGGPGDARKIAQHTGRPADPRHRDETVDEQAGARLVDYVRRWLPGLVPEPFGETTCLYTSTPSTDFLIDRVGDVVVASACSGHGAKLAPTVGRVVADLVDGTPQQTRRFTWGAHARAAAASP